MNEFNKMPFTSIKLKSIENFAHKIAIQRVENFDNVIMSEIIKIAKEQGYTDLVLIDKEFVVEALKREMARRNSNG